jgi:ribosomal protein S18 acetylase RimI-like enzyme
MDRVRIGRLGERDVDACARIVAEDPLWRRYGLSLPRARRLVRGALAARRRGGAAAREAGEIAVARAGRRVLGFVWFHRTGTFAHSGYVRWIAIAPDARGAGVGRRLMAHAERRILAAGPNVFLLVSEFNAAARAFYRRLGYTEVGRIPDYVVPGVAERLLRKTTGPIEGGRTR